MVFSLAGGQSLADQTNQADGQPPSTPANQALLLRKLAENLSAVTSMEAIYDLNIQLSAVGPMYETRLIIADFATGRYVIRSLHFRDPERKIGTGCSVEVWDGKQYTKFSSGLTNASLADLSDPRKMLMGVAVIGDSSDAFDPIVDSRQNPFGANSLADEMKSCLEAHSYRFIDQRTIRFGGNEVDVLDGGNVGEIRIFANGDAGSEWVLRDILLGDYKEVEGKPVPTIVTVKFASLDHGLATWNETFEAHLLPASLRINAPLNEDVFHMKLPAGVIVRDNIKNVQYTVPEDQDEYSGKDLKNHTPLGLSDMKADKKIWAKSLLGQKGPAVVVEKWLTAAPDLRGKFVLLDLWATWCGPCRKSIPALNELQEKFGDKLTVVGISGEDEKTVRGMTIPAIKYAIGIDPENRVAKAVELKAFPHVILMDPKGIVRWEGFPLLDGQELTNQVVEEIIARYGK